MHTSDGAGCDITEAANLIKRRTPNRVARLAEGMAKAPWCNDSSSQPSRPAIRLMAAEILRIGRSGLEHQLHRCPFSSGRYCLCGSA